MNVVQVKDKEFVMSIPEALILERVKAVAQEINHDMQGKNPLIITVLNGAFVFAADLVRALTIPCETSFVKLASYEGTCSTGEIKRLIGLNENIEGRAVIVVEDIIDSGLTMQQLIDDLKQQKPAEVHVCALLVKPDNLKVPLTVKYCCMEIPNDFIVGYGLDYDGYGRNLRDIYTVAQ